MNKRDCGLNLSPPIYQFWEQNSSVSGGAYEMFDWHKISQLFIYRVTQNNSDALADALLKWNYKNFSIWVHFNSFIPKKRIFSKRVIFNLAISVYFCNKVNKIMFVLFQVCGKNLLLCHLFVNIYAW